MRNGKKKKESLKSESTPVHFEEEQHFTESLIWLIIVTLGFLPTVLVIRQLAYIDYDKSENYTHAFLLIIVTVITLITIYLLGHIKLKTEINSDEVKVAFLPFIKRKIKWSEVKKAKVIDYGFMGGWGVRFWTKYGTVYNVRGSIGLSIELKNGRKFLIGTQRGSELYRTIKKCLPKPMTIIN